MKPPKEIQKHNKVIGIVLAIIVILLLAQIGFTLLQKPKPQVNNFVGQQGIAGPSGESIQGPQGIQGTQGVQGPVGATGAQGPLGQTGATGETGSVGPQGMVGPQGTPGDPGADGRSTEFRCNPKNHSYEWRYVGDDSWQTLQKNSLACQSAS